MGNQNQYDMGGIDLVVRSLRQADTPGATSTEVIDANGNVVVDSSGDVTATTLTGSVQTLTGAGAVNLTTLITAVATTGADALTLADGSTGQIKIITMITDGGDGTLTPTNLAGGTTITFGDVGDSVILVFVDGEWQILSNNGATVA